MHLAEPVKDVIIKEPNIKSAVKDHLNSLESHWST